MTKNKVYRERLLPNNAPLLRKILEAARNKSLSVHSTDINWEQIEVDEDSELSSQAALTKVYRCNVNGVTYAVKNFNVNDIQFSQKEFQSEIALMSLLNHKNIVSAVAASTQKPHLFILANLYTRGSLTDVMKAENLHFSTVLRILLDAARGMEYLHSLNIIHRDVKPGNILVGDDFSAAVSDFGTSRVCKDRMTPTVGTAIYMAPDLVESTSYTKKADVYSFGITMWEVMERRSPFPSSQPIDIIFSAKAGVRPTFTSNCPLQDLIRACWDANPEIRPSFAAIEAQLEELQKNVEDYVLAAPSAKNTSVVRLPPKLSKDISRESLINQDAIEPQPQERTLVPVNEKRPKKTGKLRSLKSQTSKRFDRMKMGFISKNKPSPDIIVHEPEVSSTENGTEDLPVVEKPKRVRRRKKTFPVDSPANLEASGMKVKQPQKSPRKSSPRRRARKHREETEKPKRTRRKRRRSDKRHTEEEFEKKQETEQAVTPNMKPRSNTIHSMPVIPEVYNETRLPVFKPLLVAQEASLPNSRSFDLSTEASGEKPRLRSSSTVQPEELEETVQHAKETVASIVAKFQNPS